MRTTDLHHTVAVGPWPADLTWGPSADAYRIGEVTPKCYTIVRVATGSQVKITWTSVRKVLARLVGSSAILHGATVKAGGISTTSAKSWGTMLALRNLVAWDGIRWTLDSGSIELAGMMFRKGA